MLFSPTRDREGGNSHKSKVMFHSYVCFENTFTVCKQLCEFRRNYLWMIHAFIIRPDKAQAVTGQKVGLCRVIKITTGLVYTQLQSQ